jgi:hypothetical protein
LDHETDSKQGMVFERYKTKAAADANEASAVRNNNSRIKLDVIFESSVVFCYRTDISQLIFEHVVVHETKQVNGARLLTDISDVPLDIVRVSLEACLDICCWPVIRVACFYVIRW